MTLYKISPYAHIIENRLIPSTIQYGIFHQFTGYVIEPRESVKVLLLATRMGTNVSLSEDDLVNLGDEDVISGAVRSRLDNRGQSTPQSVAPFLRRRLRPEK